MIRSAASSAPAGGVSLWRRTLRANAEAFAFLTPVLAFVLVVYLYPIVQLLFVSLHRVPNVTRMQFVGLDNFRRILQNELFLQSLLHNVQLLPAVPVLLLLSALFSALLLEQMRGWRIYRAIIFLPYVLPVPVIGIAFGQMLQLHGVVNTILESMGLGFLAADWIGDESINIYVIAAVIVWKELGFGTVLFLARLLSVPQEIFDAATVDGAGWWRQFIQITLPQLRGIAAIFAVLEMFNILSWIFGYIYTMTSGGPGTSTMVIEMFVYRTAFEFSGDLGLASAVCALLFVLVLTMIPLRARLEGESYEA